MKVNLFGVGTKSQSNAITAQRRINCYVDVRQDNEKTSYVLIGRPGLRTFVNTLGANTTRGMWAVNTLATPLLFVVQANTLYSINNAGVASVIGLVATTSGNVSLVDDGTYLVLVDGQGGWYYDMVLGGALTQITDGNFTTTPGTVTWQDDYFIVTSSGTNQFQLNNGVTPATWPAVNINFSGSAPGALRAGIADHSVLMLFGDVYSEFWQDAGSAGFPYANISGSAQEFGLASAATLSKFDNSLVGLFKNKLGGVNVSRLSGFSLTRLSNSDIETILSPASNLQTGVGFSFMTGGHPLYVLNLPDASISLMYDGASGLWSELQSYGHTHFRGTKFASFLDRLCVADHHSGDIWQFDTSTYDDAGDPLSMEVWSKHIWQDDKYLSIDRVQIDVESGVGTATGQGANPVMDLQVSKDGGNTFFSVGYGSMGAIGQYTQRVKWSTLGAARDWVLKLVITDPVKRIITGATAEISGGSF